MPEKTNQERVAELLVITMGIEDLIEKAKAYGQSRPMSLAITKLEEAELWITKEAEPLV